MDILSSNTKELSMIKKASSLFLTGFICAGLFIISNSFTSSDNSETFQVPLGLLPIPWPDDNPYTQKKAELGRLLFFDKRLSSNGTISCASCHINDYNFTDLQPVSTGIFNHHGTRNAPTVVNTAYLSPLLWDGRAETLEEQCKGPIANLDEMTDITDTLRAHKQCEENIRSVAGYRALFKEVFGNDNCSIDDIAKAVATFERTILSGNSAYDRYIAGDKKAMTEQQIMGFEIFKKVDCNTCHSDEIFTSSGFANIGIGMDVENPDLGRYAITKVDKDYGAFRVPTLRDVALSPPYMHDGRFKTLEEVIEYYDVGGIPNKGLSHRMKPLNLSKEQKAALVSFMHALNGEGWQHIKEPDHFPE